MLLLIDGAILTAVPLLAAVLRFDFQVPPTVIERIWHILPLYVVGSVGIFYLLRLYDGLWRYASLYEAVGIVVASVCSSGYFYLVLWMRGISGFPRSVPLIGMMITLILLGGSRLSVRIVRNYITRRKVDVVQTRSLIYGADEAGAKILDDLLANGDRPIGFIDDNASKFQRRIRGVPVLGDRLALPNIVKKYGINDLIIATPSASRQLIREIYNIVKKADNLSIRVVPALHDIATGKVEVGPLRPIDLSDLLGRDPVKIDLQQVAGYLKDRSVMVTGAGGSIGSELCRQIVRFQPKDLILLDHDENAIFDIRNELAEIAPSVKLKSIIADVRDSNKITHVFKTDRPDVVFHAAAHKHVPFMEDDPEEAVKTNVFGTENVALAAKKYGAERFVLISTDKAVNPTSVMGASKRVGEYVIQSANDGGSTRFMAVRFGNVLGSRGSVVPLFQQQIAAGGPVTVTDPEMIRYFMTIPEAVQLVVQAAALGTGGEVFVLDMGEPVKIVDLARTLITLHGLEPDVDIEIEFTGRRPGEKLYEEILTAEEGTEATKYERIFSAQVSVPAEDAFASRLEQLKDATLKGDQTAVVSMLIKLIPTYEPEVMRVAKQARKEVAATSEQIAKF